MAEADNNRSKDTSVDEAFARMFPPVGFEGCFVVTEGKHLVWRREDELTDDSLINFYDGDCRDVLTPDDPRLAT